jgi:hypothetical protein
MCELTAWEEVEALNSRMCIVAATSRSLISAWHNEPIYDYELEAVSTLDL